MRYRWDPVYPTGRRYYGSYSSFSGDLDLRCSDAERNETADRLSRHFAEGRLDQTEFKTRLDTAMSATTRGELYGLFNDLPKLPAPTTSAPPARRRRFMPLWMIFGVLIVAATVTASTWPFVHVPWVLVFILAFFFWHRAGRWHRHSPQD